MCIRDRSKGVSINATSTLNINPETSSPTNKSQGSAPNEHKRNITVKVSMNCEVKVEKLFLSHNILPFVFCFQK